MKLLVGFSTTGNSFHKNGGTGFAFGFDVVLRILRLVVELKTLADFNVLLPSLGFSV